MKKIICIIICMLLIATTFSVAESLKNNKINATFSSLSLNKSIEDWTELQKLLASDGESLDRFGECVSITNDYALIGAPYVDDYGPWTGYAYMFKRDGNNWDEQQKLRGSGIVEDDFFGNSVYLNGDTALIGASHDDDNGFDTGSVYVFIRTGATWTEQAILYASDSGTGDYFGYSVSIDGDMALIGAPFNDDCGVNSGCAYVFTRAGSIWTQQAKLVASDGAIQDRFGISVSLDGDTALIGAYADDVNVNNSGSAYVFTRTGSIWTQQAKLVASDGGEDDEFGYSVSIDGDTAVIGAFFDDDNGINSGSAYVFTRTGSTWEQQEKLLPLDGASDDQFGNSVSLEGDMALIGSHYDDDNGDVSGSAYLFVRSGNDWTQRQKLVASDGEEGDKFGCGVCINQYYALIGAKQDDDNGDSAGSAYVFTREFENQPPEAPIINGQTNGKVRKEYSYTFVADDPDANDVFYYIDWGDGSVEDWFGPYPSNEQIIVKHSWSEQGTYIIMARAKDTFEEIGDWGTLEVTMPKNKPILYDFPIINSILERFLNAFPIMSYIFG